MITGLQCQVCSKKITAENISIVIAEYLIHMTKSHWHYLEILHVADEELLSMVMEIVRTRAAIYANTAQSSTAENKN